MPYTALKTYKRAPIPAGEESLVLYLEAELRRLEEVIAALKKAIEEIQADYPEIP